MLACTFKQTLGCILEQNFVGGRGVFKIASAASILYRVDAIGKKLPALVCTLSRLG